MYRRPRQAGRIYPPHSAYALRVQLVCPIKDESLRRTDRPQPNTHQQEQQLNKPQKSLSPNPKGIIQENNILYNSGTPNYSCRRKQDGTYKICFLYNSVIPLTSACSLGATDYATPPEFFNITERSHRLRLSHSVPPCQDYRLTFFDYNRPVNGKMNYRR